MPWNAVPEESFPDWDSAESDLSITLKHWSQAVFCTVTTRSRFGMIEIVEGEN